MVMGPTHAVSGAAAWLAGAGVTAAVFGHPQNPVELAVYTAVCAGSALLPDLDCSGAVLRNRGGATVARTFGVASLFLAECVEKFSLFVYRITSTSHDDKRTNGHRTLTHTWLFNVLLGLGTGTLSERFGKTAVVAILFFTFGLAVRGLMADVARKSGWVLVTLLSAAAAYLAILLLPGGRGYPLLGVAVAAGGIIHTLGDMITRHGCPVIWPIIWRRQRWWEFGVPDLIAVPVDGWFERLILLPGLTAAAVFSAALAIPALRAALERFGDYVSAVSIT
jgi:membrane-bound metal-dependent hydrolase YbcI (DUF457 family)